MEPEVRPAVKNRVTVVETVYHQPFGQEPTSVDYRYSRPIESDEQPYRRLVHVNEGWKPLDLGWLKDVGVSQLVIYNGAGDNLQRNPTPEERAAIEEQVVEIADGDYPPVILVPPGCSTRIYPANAPNLFLRCQRGTVVCTLFLVPR